MKDGIDRFFRSFLAAVVGLGPAGPGGLGATRALVALAAGLAAPARAAQITPELNFQGRLTDASGSPVTGDKPFVFEIVDGSGASVWSEARTVGVLNGVFSVRLGTLTAIPASAFASPGAKLKITVDGQALSPDEALAASPYAFNAERFQGKDLSLFVTTDAQGRVGIGTTAPDSRLEVNGVGEFGSGGWEAGGIRVGHATNAIDANSSLLLQWSSPFNVVLARGGGAVGIGTETPSAKLDVQGDARVRGNLTVDGSVSGALDADTLDGLDSAQFLRSDQSGALSGGLSVSGSLGVGTTNPTDKLQVLGGQTRLDKLWVGTNFVPAPPSGGAVFSADVLIGQPSDGSAEGRLNVRTNSGDHLVLGTVGNWTVPVLRFKSASATQGVIATGGGPLQFAGMNKVQFQNSGSTTFEGSGNVGIGTTNPASFGAGSSPTILHIHKEGGTTLGGMLQLSTNQTAVDTTVGSIEFGSTGLSAGDKRLGAITALKTDAAATDPRGSLRFFTANAGPMAERMRIAPDGSVGIGTTGPASRLEVAGTIRADEVRFRTPAALFNFVMGADKDLVLNGDDNIIFRNANTEERMRIEEGGEVGIGTTQPGAKLHVDGPYPQLILNNPAAGAGVEIRLHDAGSYSQVLGHIDTTSQLQFRAAPSGAPHLAIAVTGRIGVGTTAPEARLDVAGDARVRGNLTVDGSVSGALDADTLDGLDSAQFLRSDQNGSLAGQLSVSGAVSLGSKDSPTGLNLRGRELIRFNASDDSAAPIGSGQVVGGLGFLNYGTSHAQLHYRGGTGFELLDVSNDAPSIGHASASFAPVYAGALVIGGMNNFGNYDLPSALAGGASFAGNVGIGTTGPLDALHVHGGVRASGSAANYNSGDQVTLDWNAGNARLNAQKNSGGSATLQLMTQGAARILIDGAGNVGVGTTTTLANSRLRVMGGNLAVEQGYTLDLSGGSNVAQLYYSGAYLGVGVGSAKQIGFVVNPAVRVTVTDIPDQNLIVANGLDVQGGTGHFGGSVGIGTAAPQRELHVRTNDGAAASLVLENNVGTTSELVMGPSTDSRFRLIQNGQEALTVLNSGNVGIGTAAPAGRLDVFDPAGVSGQVLFRAAALTPAWPSVIVKALGSGAGNVAPSANALLSVGDYTGGNTASIVTTGRVGIGTASPQKALHVAGPSLLHGNVYFDEDAGSVEGQFDRLQFAEGAAFDIATIRAGSGVYKDLTLSPGGAEKVRVTATGNVGIGTAVPGALLSVGSAGQLQVSSNGDLARIKNVPYSWPSAQGSANQVLTNNGTGTLSWSTPSSTAPDGSVSSKAVKSCREIKLAYPSSTSGPYWLAFGLGSAAFQVYCDMTTDGGGWTLVMKVNGLLTSKDEVSKSSLASASVTSSAKLSDPDLKYLASPAGQLEWMVSKTGTVYVLRYSAANWPNWSTDGAANMPYDAKNGSGNWALNACNGHYNNRGFSTYSDSGGGSCGVVYSGAPAYLTNYHTTYGASIGEPFAVFVR